MTIAIVGAIVFHCVWLVKGGDNAEERVLEDEKGEREHGKS
jgi:hypothetical protein